MTAMTISPLARKTCELVGTPEEIFRHGGELSCSFCETIQRALDAVLDQAKEKIPSDYPDGVPDYLLQGYRAAIESLRGRQQ